MALLDFIIGRRGLDRMKEAGDEYARSAYDPSQADPLVNQGMQQASEGLDVDSLRKQMLSSVYRDAPSMNYGISQGQDLAIGQMQDEARSQATAMGETEIGLQDEAVKREGQTKLSQALAQRKQLESQRSAALAENRLQIEAEAGRRKQQLLGGVINLASAAIDPSKIMGAFNSTKSSADWLSIDSNYNNPNAGVWGG